MINKVLLDLNVTDTKLYASRGKIQYQTKILGKEIIDEHSKKVGYTAIGFDSRNDMVAQKHCKVKKVSNCSVIDTTTGNYYLIMPFHVFSLL